MRTVDVLFSIIDAYVGGGSRGTRSPADHCRRLKHTRYRNADTHKFHRRSKVLLQTGWRASQWFLSLSIWKTMARCGLKSRDHKKL